MKNNLRQKIINKQAKIAIIGLGYVGLPLAIEFKKSGFETLGIDIDKQRVNTVNRGKSYVLDITDEELKDSRLQAFWDYKYLKDVDIIIICVPTPLRKSKEPDISNIIQAVKKIKQYLTKHKERLIILESTTYPGTTEEVILPLLTSCNNLNVGKDFYLAFSPERIDPGNKIYKTKNIPKVVGGVTQACKELACLLYEQIIEEVISVSSPKVAEMVKLLENTYRIVNIALVNEFAIMCKKLGVNVWEVIQAAKTKPFGFEAFYPGPGLGGHCIPVDPFYLSWKSRLEGYEPKFIALADQINSYMPEYVVSLISDGLNNIGKCLSNAKILILGITYKKDVADIRESPAIEIIKILLKKKAQIFYNDPYIKSVNIEEKIFHSVDLNERLAFIDCVAILTDHSVYNINEILKNYKLIVDTRGVTVNVKKTIDNLIYTL
jgi:UDP-N-acetyl-D-glucosamine dehydrogenase